MRRLNVGYFVKEGVRSIGSHGLMSFAAVCMVVACLLIMGSFSLVAVNADHMMGELEDENVFLAYIDESYNADQIAELRSRVIGVDNVAKVEFITKEQAKAAFLEDHENAVFLDVPDEVFRDRFSIHVEDIERYQETVDRVEALPGIADHQAASEIAEGMVMVRNVAAGIATVLIVILVVISLFIIANTTRLAAYARREEVAIMKMCGATNAFVCWPFVVEGLILGLVGALIAFFAQWGIYTLLRQAIAQANALTFISVLPFGAMARMVLLSFLGAGAVIGAGGSTIALRRFLKV